MIKKWSRGRAVGKCVGYRVCCNTTIGDFSHFAPEERISVEKGCVMRIFFFLSVKKKSEKEGDVQPNDDGVRP